MSQLSGALWAPIQYAKYSLYTSHTKMEFKTRGYITLGHARTVLGELYKYIYIFFYFAIIVLHTKS